MSFPDKSKTLPIPLAFPFLNSPSCRLPSARKSFPKQNERLNKQKFTKEEK